MLPSELWEQAIDTHCPLTDREAMIDMAEMMAGRVSNSIAFTGWRFQKCSSCAQKGLFHLLAIAYSINNFEIQKIYAMARDVISLFDSEVLNAAE